MKGVVGNVVDGVVNRALATGEVGARHVVERAAPAARERIGRWVREGRVLRDARRAADAAARDVSLGQLEEALRGLGVGSRDLVLHSSWAGLKSLRARPADVIALCRKLAGDEHTLLVPAHPMETFDDDGALIYDVEKAPSRMGMVSESMRRVKGVRRSPLPIAPVFAVGPSAEAYTRDYRLESGGTPWGRGSPWWELCQRNGQAVVAGVDFIRSLTLLHVAFDVLRDENPISDYDECVACVIKRGVESERVTLLRQRRSLERHLATTAFARMAVRSGTVKVAKVGDIKLAVVDAKAFFAWHLPIARATGLPYWGFARRGGVVERARQLFSEKLRARSS